MSEHPNVSTVNRMTQAIFDQDAVALGEIFAPRFCFHLRGPHPLAGDHDGVEGFLTVLQSFFEMTGGNIQLDQQFCIAGDDYVAEWERATLGANGRSLESWNSFVYRFEGGRVADMWMYLGATLAEAEAVFA
jgi:ketosteroid isomerase-like protein